MTSVLRLQPSQRATLDALLAGFRRAFGADLSALYVSGAITFPETEGIVDLDYHAILERPPNARPGRRIRGSLRSSRQ